MMDVTQVLPLEKCHQLSTFVHRRFGMFFPEERYGDLLRAVVHACEETHHDNPQLYVDWVLSGSHTDGDLEALVTSLTIGETYFFRDPSLFKALRETIIPQRLRYGDGERRLRIWSAGCSTGEEPYSIAMLLDYYGGAKEGWQAEILATDVNVRSLSRARKGVYSRWSFRGLSTELQQRYFSQMDAHHWGLNDPMRQRVQFSYLNLAAPPFRLTQDGGKCDVILCRNVLMYFSAQLRQQILNELSRMLVDGGWLVVSPSEAGLVKVDGLRSVNIGGMVFHQKGGGALPETIRPVTRTPRPEKKTTAIAPQRPVVRKPVARSTAAAEKNPAPVAERSLTTMGHKVDQGEYTQVIPQLETFLVKETLPRKEQATALLLLARCHANVGDTDQAQHYLEQTLQLDQMNPAAHYLDGVIALERQEYDRARHSLERTLYLDENYIMAQLTLGMLVGQFGETSQQEKSFARVRLLLGRMSDEEIVPDSGGMTAAHLRASL